MAKEIDYGKWIADAIDNNPRLSRSGLSRHLGHGNDRGRVIRMISGDRKIKAGEVAEIAAYLGVPPPGAPGLIARLDVAGIIDPRVWREGGVEVPSIEARVPPVPDPRWDARLQSAYLMAVECGAPNVIAGDYLITVPQTPKTLEPDRLVVGRRERAGLVQLTLCNSLTVRGTTLVRSLLTPDVSESVIPVGLVIAVYRSLIP